MYSKYGDSSTKSDSRMQRSHGHSMWFGQVLFNGHGHSVGDSVLELDSRV
jgi:hypothetical protein